MKQEQIIDNLNRLLAIESCSLANYLGYAEPWTQACDAPLLKTLRWMLDDREDDCRRIAQAILDRDGSVESGGFPIEFASLNDLALSYLWGKLIEHQRSGIAAIERCAAQLADDEQARRLAEEVLGREQAHLDRLTELAEELSARRGSEWCAAGA
jgi:hypothetical protein